MKNLFREVDIRMHMVIVYVVEEIAGPAIFNNLKGGKMKKKIVSLIGIVILLVSIFTTFNVSANVQPQYKGYAASPGGACTCYGNNCSPCRSQ